ncbi:MAG: D-glycero-beta-D-manno-heptose-7-phosphate kinase [Helicobacter sp.]|nr:D-glycero-beta-D-manno-heptose-7-phosphate kinase [Helicobacter sp.]
MINIINSIKKDVKILVIGDLMIDSYIWGETNRISPEAPVQVLNVKNKTNRLGGACNVANNLISLGAKVFLCGVIGSDEAGSWLKNELESIQINTDAIISHSHQTTRKTRVIATNQQLLRIDEEENFSLKDEVKNSIISHINELKDSIDAIILSDYNKGVLSPDLCQSIIEIAKNKLILCDPKGRDFSKYRGATLLTPNKKEAQIATDIKITDNESLQKALLKLKSDCDLLVPLITLSEGGIAFLDDGGLNIVPTVARDVFDVTGAGDTAIAALALCMSSNIALKEACIFANACASVVVGKIGAATATLDEVKAKIKMQDCHINTPKVLSISDLVEKLPHIRDQKIIFTNGCFDILHRGHLEYLKEAKSLGDILIVGINSDRSVRALKGSSRPINKQDDRAFMMANLFMVDFVVIFDEDSPESLIKAISPDVLVKGGDYKPSEIKGAEFAKSVHISPFVNGCSTSNIIQKIRENNAK